MRPLLFLDMFSFKGSKISGTTRLLLLCLLLANCFKLTAQDHDFGKVSLAELQQKQHPLEPEANAAILYRNQRVYYGSNFDLFTEVHERIKIYNKQGFDRATRKILLKKEDGTDENIVSLKAYTYSLQDGQVVEQKLSKNDIFEEDVNEYFTRSGFSMPAVTEGSVLEIQYTIKSPFFWALDRMPLQFDIPVNRLEVKVDIPDIFLFKMAMNPRAPLQLAVKESKENFKNGNLARAGLVIKENVYEVNADNVPAMKKEDYIDHLDNYRAYIDWDPQVSKYYKVDAQKFTNSWEEVVESIYEHQGYEKALKAKFFSSEVEQAVQGLSEPVKKAEALFALLKERITWNGNYGYRQEEGLKDAWKNGVGNTADINLTLTAMLRASGLEAYPVLLSTKDNGVPTFPTRIGFNYVITAVEVNEGKFLFLDASEKTAGPGELPSRARNWQGRLLQGKKQSRWIDVMPDYTSIDHTAINYVVGEDLVVKGRVNHHLNKLFAKSFRDRFLELKNEDYLQQLEKDKGNIRITEVAKEDEKTPGKSIKESFKFEIADAVESVNDRLYFKPLLFLAEADNPFKADTRTYPVFFEFPATENKTISLMIPQGYKVEFLPESVVYDLNNGAGTYKFVAVQEGMMIRIESRLDLNTTVYTPQDYAALKKFFGKMAEKQTETVVLQKG